MTESKNSSRNKRTAQVIGVRIFDEEKVMKVVYNKHLLGISSSKELFNSLWLDNSLHFGLRRIQDYHNMCSGDVID